MESKHTMEVNDWALIKLPSSNIKLVQLKANSTISMGKFGSFAVSQVIGLPYGISYEVVGRNEVRPASKEMISLDYETEDTKNNQSIQDTKDSQKLSHSEIEELKKEALKGGMSSEQLIKLVVENSETFEKKTEFAKAKYIKRKEKKFSKVFTPVKPSLLSLCEFYFTGYPQKIKDIRIDTLSQLLVTANIRPGGKYLVVEEMQGFIVAAILERTGLDCQVCLVSEHDATQSDVVKYMNFDPKKLENCLTSVSWRQLEPDYIEDLNDSGKLEKMQQSAANTEASDRLQKRAAKARRLLAAKNMLEGGVDGLIIAGTSYKVQEVVDRLSPYLGYSRSLVVYAQLKEMLTPAYASLRTRPDYINIQLTDGWLREYQVPIYSPGTHPFMVMSGTGGYLMSAVRVNADAKVELLPKPGKRGKRKQQDDREGKEEVSPTEKKPKIEEN